METVQSEAPVVIEGHAFTTGAVPRTSIEHVLPNSWVEFGVKDGLGYQHSPFRGARGTGSSAPQAVILCDLAATRGFTARRASETAQN